MRAKDPTKCNDYGDDNVPNCLGTPDPRYTMRFDEIGEQPILWCANCGPLAQAMDEGLTKAFMADPLNFPKTLEDAIDKAETDVVVDEVVQALKAKR
jgi:hypothetical protein